MQENMHITLKNMKQHELWTWCMNPYKLYILVVIANLFFSVYLDPCTTINPHEFPQERERDRVEREGRERGTKKEREWEVG